MVGQLPRGGSQTTAWGAASIRCHLPVWAEDGVYQVRNDRRRRAAEPAEARGSMPRLAWREFALPQ